MAVRCVRQDFISASLDLFGTLAAVFLLKYSNCSLATFSVQFVRVASFPGNISNGLPKRSLPACFNKL